jgi:hypothetical protein
MAKFKVVSRNPLESMRAPISKSFSKTAADKGRSDTRAERI